jgi:co-chaperonin GroES (HSP10)
MLTPLGKRIIIQPLELPKGSLLITNSKPTQFKIVAIGDETSKVSIGDIVYLDKFAGCEIEHNKEKFIVVEEAQILAKVD